LSKIFFLFILLFSSQAYGAGILETEKLVEQVDSIRKALVTSVVQKPDEELFNQVCKPVGMNIKKIYDEKKIKIRQASHKPRNPKNKADKNELLSIKMFSERNDINSVWLKIDGKRHYFKRITVQKNCLACHGEKSKRPSFVKGKYLADKAFDFKVGDIRGVYHVIVE